MKALMILLAAALVLGPVSGCFKKEKDGKEKKKGALDQATDYATGKTQTDALKRAEATIIQTAIQNAVQNYVVYQGKKPISLKELVDQGLLDKKYLDGKYGLQSEFVNGKFVVRGIGRDGKPDTDDDWVKEY